MTIRVCIFDAYGTLFDVGAAARRAASEPGFEALGDAWPRLADLWRQKQLQYTWLRAITDDHCSFDQVTEDGLDWALEAMGLSEAGFRTRLLELYRRLDAYPEVPRMLRALKDAGIRTGILSNGSDAMLAEAVASAGIGPDLDEVLSVDAVGVFKPSDRVYDLVGRAFGVDRDDVLFVSSNGWDAAGAAGYGFHTAWVNRAGDPLDRLPGQPALTLTDLTPIPQIAREL